MVEHRIGFSGTVAFVAGLDAVVGPRDLVVMSLGVPLDDAAGAVQFAVDGRPERALVNEIAAAVRGTSPASVVGIGDGAVLDAAKLAAYEAGHDGPIVLAPGGGEPWRAFAPFAVVDDGRARPTVGDATGGRARVVIVDELLDGLDESRVAIAAIDTAVHAIESLLSPRREPYSEALAMAALRFVADAFADPGSLAETAARVRAVVAAGLAVESFMSSALGLAHAIASPLGTELGVEHDALNGILGPPTVAFWAESHALPLVASSLGVEPDATEIVALLERYLDRARLPRTLGELGVPWQAVEAVLPAALGSSGLVAIRDEVDDHVLRSFARGAWAGAIPMTPRS